LEALVFHPADMQEDETVISRSLHIKGELLAQVDLVIHGQIEGQIIGPQSQLMIKGAGRIRGDIHARSIIIEGLVRGDLYASETVTLSRSADVEGKIEAPEVVMEKGSRFNGNVRMDVVPTAVAVVQR
jgi:cytoskeletal protein CcmA (bactofilin family)